MKKITMIAVVIGVLVVPSAPSLAAPRPNSFTIMASAEGTKVKFPYKYKIGWVAGDRVGYSCAYMFLRSRGQLVARVTFTRIEYVMLNDKYMDEAARFYDGTVYTGSDRELDDCPAPSEPYVHAYGPFGPLPIMKFSDPSTGTLLEVRDYRKLVQNGGGVHWEFKIVAATPDRVTVIGYQSREPALAIYYDRLTSRIKLTSNAPAHDTGSSSISWASGWHWASQRS